MADMEYFLAADDLRHESTCFEVASVSAQVETRSYPEGDALAGTRFENLLQRRSVTDVKKMAAFDASALLLEDSIIHRTM